jgi:hypothetical protein
LLIGPGIYRESVRISKNIALIGAGPDLVRLQPPSTQEAIFINFEGPPALQIHIANLSAQAFSGIRVKGSVHLSLQNVHVSLPPEFKYSGFGIQVTSNATVTLVDARIEGAGFGLLADPGSQVYLSRVTFDDVSVGLFLQGSAQARVFDSEIYLSKTHGGSGIGGGSSVLIHRSKVVGNGRAIIGVSVGDESRYYVTDSVISGHARGGIEVRGSGKIVLIRTTISDNGQDMQDTKGILSGGVLISPPAEKAVAVMENNRLISNKGWGIAASLKECFPALPEISAKKIGQISGSKNLIPDKNDPEANQLGDVCPAVLRFLKTEQGGRYPGP